MSKKSKRTAKWGSDNNKKEEKTSLYKPDAANAMAAFRHTLYAELDSPESFYMIQTMIATYRRSQGCSSIVTPKYVYKTIRILQEFTKTINFHGACELTFHDFENPRQQEHNPYITQIVKKINGDEGKTRAQIEEDKANNVKKNITLTTIKEHLRAIVGAGIMQFDKIKGKRCKLKRLNPAILDALGLLGKYEALENATRVERSNLQKKFKDMRKKAIHAAKKALGLPTHVFSDVHIEPIKWFYSAQNSNPDIPF